MAISVIFVPEKGNLETHWVSWDESSDSFRDDIQRILHQSVQTSQQHPEGMETIDFLETPLLRPRHMVAGLYAYHNIPEPSLLVGRENIPATRLAMTCGWFSLRFYGPVLLVRSFGGRWQSLMEIEIYGPTYISPDIHPQIQEEVAKEMMTTGYTPTPIPEWLASAMQHNYHDGAELAKVISAMNRTESDDDDDDDDDEEEDSDSGSDQEDIQHIEDQVTANDRIVRTGTSSSMTTKQRQFVTSNPLCLHCRRLSSDLCPSCEGAYFCTIEHTGRDCRTDGWTHACLCSTWKVYCHHRNQLSNFNNFFGEWQPPLMERSHQLGEEPYKIFLQSLGIDVTNCTNWWRTEMGGWSGGQSTSASGVDASIRLSYQEGFAPITELPSECHISLQDRQDAGLELRRNAVGLLQLSSWEDYYKLRRIPPSSPISLLCTFPLTIYHAIERYGDVPVTVARMLRRPLRIHVVGAEKEINFLDLFQEVTFLLPEDLTLELVFIVREDMLPTKCKPTTSTHTTTTDRQFAMRIEYDSLVIGIVTGTYGGTSLDPNFDCGTGPPDMVIGMNAGLYAYESWRSVVNYLYRNTGVVGVFTDYNEYSGTNCAALGGVKSRQSLCMNPFRQPRCMPVYSMNLPQFSNGFLYTFNEQELE